ncbi:MAG: methylated-DNA--[protein]-cysteine S-methyltransferase [Chloroflexi bacterium]|nr:methylated-DNA--[protein]-cysteine S-methyltransferase [Chloroflexota bacterium]
MSTTREIIRTAIGPLFVGASGAGLHRVDFVRPGRDEAWLDSALELDAARARDAAPAGSARATLAEALGQLDAYFRGRPVEFALPLAPRGTAFQRAVWSTLCAIPAGERRSYRQIAGAVERPNGARAVGQAVSRNPLAVVVPCHRVVGSDGSLTGYAGGIERKRWLLARDAEASPGPAR